ncbi:glyoxalase-like protein [Dysgonomonas alginatilytica]|uniref:Glyoxalase-like protein n=1 Tax=Dysgonomonas alginatilytica TaxID=1605892 RepID=A0A2V3PNF9_9BACT|nr:VOC family protein [Dysgonomonas alginatilytica]PXV62650.1 glyoxalase-like protein [Dysgonomonas alginatilytica]
MDRSIAGAEILLKSLLNHDVSTIFGYPGSCVMLVLDHLYNYKDSINHIPVRLEKGAIRAVQQYAQVSFEVSDVDEIYKTLSANGVKFINQPTDMPDWGMRVVHLRDPEENLIELFTSLAPEQCSEELIEENKKY